MARAGLRVGLLILVQYLQRMALLSDGVDGTVGVTGTGEGQVQSTSTSGALDDLERTVSGSMVSVRDWRERATH